MPDSERAVEELRERLHRLHGNSIGIMRQQLVESEMKDAHKAAAEATAYHRLLSVLDHYDEEGEFPALFREETADHYAAVSRAVRSADTAVSQSQEPEPTRYHD